MDIETIKVEISKLELEPEDVLLIKFNTSYPLDKIEFTRKYFSSLLPNIKVVVYTPEIEFSILKFKENL